METINIINNIEFLLEHEVIIVAFRGKTDVGQCGMTLTPVFLVHQNHWN